MMRVISAENSVSSEFRTKLADSMKTKKKVNDMLERLDGVTRDHPA